MSGRSIRRLSRGEYGSGLSSLDHGSVLAVLGGVLVVYVCVPFLAFVPMLGGITVETFTDPTFRSAVASSLVTAPISTLLATVFGVPLAYVLARRTFPGKVVVDGLVVLPLVMPPVVAGVMLLSAFGQFTPLGSAAETLGIALTDSYVGIVLAQTFVAAPFLVITARSGFAAIDEEIEHAARSLGKGPLETFRYVSLPLARGSIVAGIVLTFARAVGEFGATMMTAYHPHTMPTQIWVTFISHGVEATAPLVLTLVAVGLAAIVAIQRLNERLSIGP